MSISLNNVSYSYRSKFQTINAVNGVSYVFEPGKCYAIIGKSGSGKTTLLSLIAGLNMPTEGEIIIDGISTRNWDQFKLLRDSISVIYQNHNLFPLLTVQENIQYPLTLKKMTKDDAMAKAREVRKRVGLHSSYNKRFPRHLSSDEQQRVAIARALAQGCRIILADEPTDAPDSTNTHNIVEILTSLAHDDGCTVIIVTHDHAVAEQADVVLEITDEGKISEREKGKGKR